MYPKKLKAKVAAAVITATLCSAGVAAAATGNLPDRVKVHVGVKLTQPSEASDAITHEGDDADEPDDTTTTSASTSSTSTSTTSTTEAPTSSTEADDAAENATPVGPDVNGPAKKGLCNAYLGSLEKGHPKNPDAVAFKNLVNGAALAGQTVEEFCATDSSTSTTATSGSSSTATTADNVQRGNGNGNGHGKP
jgi:hypothetical protein